MWHRAIFFRPKTLKDPLEHKNGFTVLIQASTAFNIIKSAKNHRIYTPNPYQGLDANSLKNMTEKALYDIESSHSNYIEILAIIFGLMALGTILALLPSVWSNPEISIVQPFLVAIVVLIFCIFIHSIKNKKLESLVEHFLLCEDALYHHNYGRSQYRQR